MKVHTEIGEYTDVYDINHEQWVGREAALLGYPIAGTIGDLYEDAVILIPGLFQFDWKKGKVMLGRVLHIRRNGHEVRTFVIMDKDGVQFTCSYGNTYPCYFALPEYSENVFRLITTNKKAEQ